MKISSYTFFNILFIITMLIIFSSTILIFKNIQINEKQNTVLDLYQLKTDILNANLALKNAALSINDSACENELSKMLVTRYSATTIYDRITATNLNKFQLVILNELKINRPVYREHQQKIVNNIRKKETSLIWYNMTYYNTLMDQYIQRVDIFITSINNDIKYHQNVLKYIILFTLSIVVILLIYVINKIYKFYQCVKLHERNDYANCIES